VLAANVVSITGNALTQMGVPWFVLQSTGSAAKAGIVAFCTTLPVVVSAMAAGPVIDRIGRRHVSIASDLICAIAVAAIPVLQLAGVLRFWMLCGLMALTGLSRAPGETARGVLLPTLASRAEIPLTRAAGFYDGAARCAAMIGAAVGGVLIALLGAEHVLLVDAATFVLSAVLLAFGLRGLPEARPQSPAGPASLRTYRRELGEGYRYVISTRLLLGICLMTLATRGLDEGWSTVLLPVHTREELSGPVDLGLLEATFAICALTGALTYGAIGSRFRRWPVFTTAFLIVGMPRFAVAALTHTFTPLAVMMAIEGLACGVLNPIMATVTYETVPEELRSRVLSAITASVLTITPLGGLITGVLVDSAGAFTTMLAIGGIYLLTTLSPLIIPTYRQMDPSGTRWAKTHSGSRSSRSLTGAKTHQ
jgi:MFS family permease